MLLDGRSRPLVLQLLYIRGHMHRLDPPEFANPPALASAGRPPRPARKPPACSGLRMLTVKNSRKRLAANFPAPAKSAGSLSVTVAAGTTD
jgi:hypothetical protein